MLENHHWQYRERQLTLVLVLEARRLKFNVVGCEIWFVAYHRYR